MSYMIFPIASLRGDEDAIKNYCPDEFKKFESLLEKHDVSKRDLAVLSDYDLLECLCKEDLDEIDSAWESLRECLQRKTGIPLALVGVDSNLEYAEDPSLLDEGFYAVDIESFLESLKVPVELVLWCEGG